jgi:hypothetical protein
MRQADPAASFIFFIFHFFVGGLAVRSRMRMTGGGYLFYPFFSGGKYKSDLCVSFVFISGWMWS